MPQLLFAFAFSAAPLRLYVPPVRSLNSFVEAVEPFLRQTALFGISVYPRLRLAFSRITSFWIRVARSSPRQMFTMEGNNTDVLLLEGLSSPVQPKKEYEKEKKGISVHNFSLRGSKFLGYHHHFDSSASLDGLLLYFLESITFPAPLSL